VYYGSIPDGKIRLTTDTTTEVFQPITDWLSSMEAITAVTAFLFLAGKTGNFQCRLGIQTCSDPDAPNGPGSLGADGTQIGTAGTTNGRIYHFDPTTGANGNIGAAGAYGVGVCQFRLGILYSLSAAGTGQGEVGWKGLAWR
jgi:hypothetical protein